MRPHHFSIGGYVLMAPCVNSRGAILITALMLMTAMAVLGPFLIQTTTVETTMTGNYLKSTQALYAAEAGVNRLIRKYRNDPALFTQSKNMADMTLPVAKPKTTNLSNEMAYWYTNLTYGAGNPPQFVEFESHGTTLGSKGHATISTRILYDPPKPFDYGLFAEDQVVLNGQGDVDSYNACNAPYDSNNPSENGDIGTNAKGEKSIVLNGNPSIVHGDASVGQGGDPSADIDGNGTITGNKTALEEPKELTTKKAPTGGVYTDINLTGHQVGSLGSGQYETSDLKLSSSATLHITGDVTLYVSGDMNITGSAQIIVEQGASLSLYVANRALIGGQGILNENQLPSTLMLYGTDTSQTIQLTGQGDFYGVIHAPTADVKVAGLGDMYGAAIGKTLTTDGNGAFHYDECLGSLIDTTADPFRVVFWRLD